MLEGLMWRGLSGGSQVGWAGLICGRCEAEGFM